MTDTSLHERIARLPQSPGVYVMKAAGGEVLYIGKASNLRSRVRSYFSGSDPRLFVQLLDGLLDRVEVILTRNPKEALLLENTLIKKHRPRFNAQLQDDKNYLSLRIDPAARWPRVEVVRKIRDDGARYFGPFHSAQQARQTLNVVNRHFQLRTCRDVVLANRRRPCLQHQIGRCPAPCVLPVDRDAYGESVQHVLAFLGGRGGELVDQLRHRMEQAAEALEFEQAARLRDQITAIDTTLQKQGAVLASGVDQDVFGLAREGEDVAIAVLQFRSGALGEVRRFRFAGQVFPDGEVLGSFLGRFYLSGDRAPPGNILVSTEVEEHEALESALETLTDRPVRIEHPKRGDRRQIVEVAVGNARNELQENVSATARGLEALEKLRKRLHLRSLPRTIECYDISNFQGRQVVAAQVCFRDGLPDRPRYRRYRIRTVEGQDDFASMFEVLQRRARRALDGVDPMPDLVVIDGGKGQLAMAVAALQDLGLHEQEVVSLAKARTLDAGDDESARRSEERVFLPGARNAIELPRNTDERHLMERIRDEAHRTAITYHRELRRRASLRSGLDDIPGIGAQRKAALLSHFGSLRRIRAATLVEIEQVDGLSRKAAWAVFDHFHPNEASPPESGADSIERRTEREPGGAPVRPQAEDDAFPPLTEDDAFRPETEDDFAGEEESEDDTLSEGPDAAHGRAIGPDPES